MENNQKIYAMELVFTLDIAYQKVKEQMQQLNMPYPIMKNEATVVIDQAVPFLPDDSVIERYKKIIMNGLSSDKLSIEDAHYQGARHLCETDKAYPPTVTFLKE